MYHVTQAKRKLKQRLLDELPQRLLEADADADDGLKTPGPYEIHTTDMMELPGLPALELVVLDSQPTVDSYAKVYRHRLAVAITAGGDDEETITLILERYIWAVRWIIRDLHITPIEGTSAADTGGEQYTPFQKRPDTTEYPFVKGVFMELFVTTVE